MVTSVDLACEHRSLRALDERLIIRCGLINSLSGHAVGYTGQGVCAECRAGESPMTMESPVVKREAAKTLAAIAAGPSTSADATLRSSPATAGLRSTSPECAQRGPKVGERLCPGCGGERMQPVYLCPKRADGATMADCRRCLRTTNQATTALNPQMNPSDATLRSSDSSLRSTRKLRAGADKRRYNRTEKKPLRGRPCDPDARRFEFADGTVVTFDANSLNWWKGRSSRERGTGGFVASTVAPVFSCLPLRGTGPLRKLVLNVTHNCNLACRYCFVERDPACGASRPMTLETARKGLAMFRPPHEIDISFFGGEPLLAWDVLTQVAQEARALAPQSRGKVGCRLHVTTNGTLIDGAKAMELKRLGFSVLLSLDGPRELHDAARPVKRERNGGSSFDQVMAGLACLNAVGMRPMCRATFLGDPACGTRLVERLEFFDGLYRAGKISGVSIEPAILTEGCASTTATTLEPPINADERRYEREETKEGDWHSAAEWFVARAKAGRPFPFFFFRKMLQRLLFAEISGSECGAGRGYLTIGPDGSIFACHREAGTRIGHVDSGFDAVAREAWRDNTINRHPECGTCWARYLCGGGCRQTRAELFGSVTAPTPALCDARREMMREVFWIAAHLTRDEALAAIGRPDKSVGSDRNGSCDDCPDGSPRGFTTSGGQRR